MSAGAAYSTIQEPSRNEQVSVIATSGLIAEARNTDQNPRKMILIRNTSPNAADIITVNMGFGVAVANLGIVLRQFESFTDASDSGYVCWQGSITAICATANGKLSIFER